jgi:hypothetical protein
MHHHHRLEELALLGALAFGAYELYHLEKYGNFGIGNPYTNGISFGPTPYGNGGTYGFGTPMSGHHHHHHFL